MRKLITMGMVIDGRRFSMFQPTAQYGKNFAFVKENGICYEASRPDDMPKKRAFLAPTDVVELEDSA